MATWEFHCVAVAHPALDRCLRNQSLFYVLSEGIKSSVQYISTKSVRSYVLAFLHLVVEYLYWISNETRTTYLSVAIGRAALWVFLAINRHKAAASMQFLEGTAQGLNSQNCEVTD